MSHSKIKESAVIKAIARRHGGDMFFTQVKDGPTQIVSNHAKIDALAIKKSWTKFCITGYEVKVARPDFLKDDKWQHYLPMCNQLYFAVAPGICEISEIPDVCGMVQLTPKGGLRTVKKAPWRDIEPPVDMFIHLMFKYIGAYWEEDAKLPRFERLLQNQRAERFSDYIDGKTKLINLGHDVSRRMREDIWKLDEELSRLKRRLQHQSECNEEVRAICKVLGVVGNYDRAVKCIDEIEHLKKSGGLSTLTMERLRKINLMSSEILYEINHARAAAET